MRRMLLILTLLVATTFGCGGGGKWVPNTGPWTVPVPSPQDGYAAALYVLRVQGYHIVEDKPEQLYVRAQYLHCGKIVKNISYIAFQPGPDGQIVASVTGFHVRDNDEPVLETRFADAVARLLHQVRDVAAVPGPKPAAPPEPPGKLPCNEEG